MPEPKEARGAPEPAPSGGAVRASLDSFLQLGNRERDELSRPLVVGNFIGEVVRLGSSEGYLVSIRLPRDSTNAAGGRYVDCEFHVTSTGAMLPQVSMMLENNESLPEVALADAPLRWSEIYAVITKTVARDQQWHAAHQALIQTAQLQGSVTVDSIEAMARLLDEQEQLQKEEATVQFRLKRGPFGSDDFGRQMRSAIDLRDSIDAVLAPTTTLPTQSCSIFWQDACEQFDLPVREFQNDGYREQIELVRQIAPLDLLDALDGQPLTPVMKIEWADREWVVVSLAQGLTTPPRIGQTLRSEDISFLSLVPADSISNLP